MQITANAIQLVNPNANILFSDTPVGGSTCIVHRQGSGLVTVRGITNCQCRARFRAYFSGNIAIPTGETEIGSIQLAIAINGEPVATTTMIVTPAAVDEYFNVSSAVFLDVPAGCCSQLSVRNTSTIAINVQNANLIVERVA